MNQLGGHGGAALLAQGRLTQLGEDAHVRPFQADAGLHEGNEFLKVATALVEFRHLLQVVRIHNDVQAAQLGQTEFILFHTSIADLQGKVCHLRVAGFWLRLLMHGDRVGREVSRLRQTPMP